MTNNSNFHNYTECEKGLAMDETMKDMNSCIGYIRLVAINLYYKCI